MELSKRMQAVAAMTDAGAVAADVGCDHGYVAIWLVRQGVCPKVYAMDVRPGPLQRARDHIAGEKLEAQICTVLSDGLTGLPVGEDGVPLADTMIAAGMGGPLIRDILLKSREKAERMRTLILQPQSEPEAVRTVLPRLGYAVVAEDMVLEEGKYYPLMKAVNTRFPELHRLAERAGAEREAFLSHWGTGETAVFSREEWEQLFLAYGERLIRARHPVLNAFLRHKIEKNRELMERLGEAAADPEAQSGVLLRRKQRLEALAEQTERMERLAGWMENDSQGLPA